MRKLACGRVRLAPMVRPVGGQQQHADEQRAAADDDHQLPRAQAGFGDGFCGDAANRRCFRMGAGWAMYLGGGGLVVLVLVVSSETSQNANRDRNGG